MFNPKLLFKERLISHVKLLNRYLRYIFNGHFMIALMFIIITISVYYQRWLNDVSENFPASIVIAFAFSFVVLYNPVQSLLKEPDKVFLIVKEKSMANYFKRALMYNYVVQLYIVGIVLGIISPLYFAFFPDRNWILNSSIVVIILILKGWNLILNWHYMQIEHRMVLYIERFIRMLLTFSLFFTLVVMEHFLIFGFIYIVYLNLTHLYVKREVRLNWEQLIYHDAERLSLFYRFVSLFAQVPHMKSRIRKRKFLTSLVRKYSPFEQKGTYTYLYRLTFLRSGEYFSLFFRLTFLAIILIVFVPNVWLKLTLALLFMYMTSFQLQTLFYHYRTNIWLNLYPLQEKENRLSFIQIAIQLSAIQTVLLAISFLLIGNIIFFILMLLSGTVFNMTFHQLYVKKKIQTVR